MSTIVLRSVKGSPLSNAEVDSNFTNLNNDKTELGGTYSAGTANGVLFLSASKVLTTGSALTFDGSTLRSTQFYQSVSAAATYATQVLENTASNGYSQFLFNVGASGANGQASINYAPGIFFALGPVANDTTTPIVFRLNNASEQMRLTSTGLGIGTSSPAYKLDVKASGTFNVARFTGQGGSVSTFIYTDSAYWYFGDGAGFTGNGYTGHASNNTLSMLTAGTERVFIGATGNVGIGTSSPGAKLDVSANDTIMAYLRSSGGLSNNKRLTFSTGGDRVVLDAADNSTGAAAALVFATGGTERMRLDSSGNLGIGTSSPDSKLHVVSGASTTLAQLRIGFNGTSVNYYDANTHYFRDGSGPTDRMILNSSGNLGLGVTPSAWGGSFKALQVGDRSAIVSVSNSTILSSNYFNDGTADKYMLSAAASIYQQIGGDHRWLIAPSGTAGDAISFTQAMTLTAAGDLLVGQTGLLFGPSNTKSLELNGTAGSTLVLNAAGALGTYIFQDSSNLKINNFQNGFVSFGTNNAERARIDSSGNLLVGTTSSSGGGSAPHVKAGVGIACRSGNAGSYGGNQFNLFYTGSVTELWIDGTNFGTITTSSDYRIKKNITTQTASAIDRVLQLRPVTYEFSDYGDLFKADGVAREGFIAHELAEVIPSAVEGRKDAENQIQSLKIDALVSVLTKAIQEQQAIIEQLKARLDAANI